MPTIAATQPAISPGISVEPHFAPEEEIGPIIVKLLDGTQRSLDIAAHAFTHTEITAAIIRAHVAGSYNFRTRADERNSENVVVIRDALKIDEALAADYLTLNAPSVQKKNYDCRHF